MKSASVCWLLGNAGLFTWWNSYWIHNAGAEREHVKQIPCPDSELVLTEILPLRVATRASALSFTQPNSVKKAFV